MNFCLQINRSAKRLICLTVTYAVLCAANAHALVAQLSTEENFYTPLSQVTTSYLDISEQETIDSIVNKRAQFQAIQTPYINFGAVETGRLWLGLRIQNTTSESGLWRLDINRQYYQELDVYLVRTKSTEHILAHTKLQNFSERPVRDRLLLALKPTHQPSCHWGWVPSPVCKPNAIKTTRKTGYSMEPCLVVSRFR